MLSTVQLAWAAGVLEGEGCFYCPPLNTSRGIALIVEMTDYDVMVKLYNLFGVGIISKVKRKTVNGKDTMRWSASGGHAMSIMYTVYPFMGERRQEKIRECALRWRAIPLRRPTSSIR